MNYESKILYGLDKIHYCKNGIMKPILGALDIEINLEQTYTYVKKQGYDSIRINGALKGSGKLSVLGLTLEEQADLLGCKYRNGELYITNSFNPEPVSLLFARDKADGSELYTIVYKCIFKNPSDIGTTKQGEIDNTTKTIEFDVLVDTYKKLTYFTIDTKSASRDKIVNFFTKIQYPEVI